MPAKSGLTSALEVIWIEHPQMTLNQLIAFLCVARDEGLLVRDVMLAAGYSQTTASRCLRSLGPPDSRWSQPPALGLLEAYLGAEDGRSRAIYLSEKGRRLQARLDDILGSKSRPASLSGERSAHAD